MPKIRAYLQRVDGTLELVSIDEDCDHPVDPDGCPLESTDRVVSIVGRIPPHSNPLIFTARVWMMGDIKVLIPERIEPSKWTDTA